MADTMGISAAHKIWGNAEETIRAWCRKGMAEGASQDAAGKPWHIPKDAKCPKPIKVKK